MLKTANPRVEMAAQLLEVEALINERAARDAAGACAAYLGAFTVGAAQAGPAYQGKLAQGLWLCWADQARHLCRGGGLRAR